MDDRSPQIRPTHEDRLATRWTKSPAVSPQQEAESIQYLQLPSPSNPGHNYIFPLALCSATPRPRKS